jgi:hypothetical protein
VPEKISLVEVLSRLEMGIGLIFERILGLVIFL